MSNLEQKIEAILFLKAEPVRIAFLAKHLKVAEEEVKEALLLLEKNLEGRGVRLLFKEDTVMLGSAPEHGELLAEITKAELTAELSRAALETLTLILYRGPINKSNIDFIRGVNSQFILRNLLVRGLIERIVDEKDKRILLYRPAFELLQYLGITRISQLPEYETVQNEVKVFEETFQNQEE
ncbi:MAG: SMC-Scp complex subunit ScpB [Parcubacteria group bacterium]|nr:SMC-Scp complex subunit ScpB [Parcubacteria group bacterium]